MSDLLGMQRAVLRCTRPTTEKIVLVAIIDHWSEASPEPWPSVPTLATLSSLGRTAVLDALAALERDGVIGVRRVAARPNRYDLSRVSIALAAPAEPVRQADQSRSPATGDLEKTAEPAARRTGLVPAPAPPGRRLRFTAWSPVTSRPLWPRPAPLTKRGRGESPSLVEAPRPAPRR